MWTNLNSKQLIQQNLKWKTKTNFSIRIWHTKLYFIWLSSYFWLNRLNEICRQKSQLNLQIKRINLIQYAKLSGNY